MLACFLYVLTLYPGVGKPAQEELDSVVGDNRLPDFSDMLEMPHLWAFVKEVLRFIPVRHPFALFDSFYAHFYSGNAFGTTALDQRGTVNMPPMSSSCAHT